jgi:hypothetical protein
MAMSEDPDAVLDALLEAHSETEDEARPLAGRAPG